VLVGRRSLKIDMLRRRHKVIKLELIQERDSIMVQGFKEAKCSQRKALEKKAHDLGFQDFSMVIGIHNVKARGKWFLTMIFMLKIGAAMG